MTLEQELALLGVIPKTKPKEDKPAPVERVFGGWKPSYPGEDPPF